MSAASSRQPVVVGVVERQPATVLRAARDLAADLGTSLVVVHVAPDPYLIGEYADPMTGGIPVGLVADGVDRSRGLTAPPALRQTVEEILGGGEVPWTLRVVEGEPALALSGIADEVDARMIVVGTRDAGVLASIAEFLSGSVAVHLAHRQQRPVVVVPLADRSTGRRAPWDLAE